MSLIDSTAGTYDDLRELVERFFRERFSTDNPLITEAIRRMLAAGGKRLRPRITLLAADCCGGNAEEHLYLAAYMELIHVATLIHDDVVDHAPTRRGVNATAVDYGNRISVLAGDYLFAWIFKNVTLNYPHPVPHVLSATLADICDGEVLQLQALGNLDLPLDTYVEIARKKTASLFAASAQCGAIMGGGSPAEIAALRQFGECFGIAFQMKDDLLDMTADERSLGKPAGNDLTRAQDDHSADRRAGIGRRELPRGGAAFLRCRGERRDSEHRPRDRARRRRCRPRRAQIGRFVERAKSALEPIADGAAKKELFKLTEALGS